MKHQYRLKADDSHMDKFGHMNHATYLQVLEEARWDWIEGRGYGMQKIQETGIGPIVLEVNIKFRREIRLHEEILINSEILKYEERIGLIHQEMTSLDGSEVKAIADIRICLFDTRSRKLVAPTPEWLQAIGWTGSP